jgi:hypothetical protein
MLSVPEISRLLRVKPEKVRGWVVRGELIGVNVSTKPSGRPVWRIAPQELDRFLRTRQSAPAPVIRRLRREKGEQAFFRQGRPVMQMQ